MKGATDIAVAPRRRATRLAALCLVCAAAAPARAQSPFTPIDAAPSDAAPSDGAPSEAADDAPSQRDAPDRRQRRQSERNAQPEPAPPPPPAAPTSPANVWTPTGPEPARAPQPSTPPAPQPSTPPARDWSTGGTSAPSADWGSGAIDDPQNGGWGAGAIDDPQNGGWGSGAIDDPQNGSWGAGAIDDPQNGSWGAGAIDDPQNGGWGSGAIDDPQNGGWGSGAIGDPENQGWGSGAIGDPENQGWGAGAIGDPENSGSIVDPQNAGTSAAPVRRSRPSYSGAAPRAIFNGTFQSALTVDTQRDDAYEDTLELLQDLELRVRYAISDRWKAVVEGRLSWWLTSAGDADTAPIVPDTERVQGRVVPQLRDFYLAGRSGRWLFRIGNQAVVWGSTDITKPADQINPLDLRRGVSGDREDLRIPVPAIDVVHAWDKVSWEFVLVPFFQPHNVAVYGSDLSPLAGLQVGGVPGVDGLSLIDPSLEDLAQPLLLQTELPEETLRNMSAGSRLTLISGGWDVSLGYFFGWDRTPRVRFSDEAAALVGAAVSQGPDFFDRTLAESPEVLALLESMADGEAPYTARYDRTHTVSFDGVTYAGPIGVRFETAISPRRTLYRSDLRPIRRPSVSSALGLSYESGTGDFVITSEVFHLFAGTRAEDGDALYGLDNLWGVAAALQLDFSAFEGARGKRSEDVAIETAVVVLPDGGDVIFSPALSLDITERLELAAGASFVTSYGDDPTVGDLLTRADAWFIRLTRVF